MFHYSNFGKFGEGLKKYADLDGYVPECHSDLAEMNWPEGWEGGLDDEWEFVEEAIFETRHAELKLWRFNTEIQGMTLEGDPAALELRYESYCNDGNYLLTYKLTGGDEVRAMATWLVDLAAKCEDGLDAGEHAVEWFGLEDPTLTQNDWTFAAVCEHEGVTLEWC